MVYDIFNRILDIPYNLFSNFLDIPSIGPFFYLEYSGIIILGLFLLTILLSKFLKFKNIFYLIILTSILGLVFKDIYLAFTTIILLTILFFVVKKFKFGFIKSIFVKNESDNISFVNKSSKNKKLKNTNSQNSYVKSTKKSIYQKQKNVDNRREKICPYCNNSLVYVTQYGRYYCYYCKKYV